MTADDVQPSHEGLPWQADPAATLGEAIEREYVDLRRGVEVLVWRTGLARAQDGVAAVADEVLQGVVVRALSRASAFDSTRSTHAWLFGIAVNVIRERRRHSLREEQRRVPPEVNPLDEQPDRADPDRSRRSYDLMAA